MRGTTLILAGFLFGCGETQRDRIAIPDPPEDRTTVISLTPWPLERDEDYDRLDRWLRENASDRDVVRVYNDLVRVAPDCVKAYVRGALAVMERDEPRGLAIANGVLEKFRDRVESDPDLQRLKAAVETRPAGPDD